MASHLYNHRYDIAYEYRNILRLRININLHYVCNDKSKAIVVIVYIGWKFEIEQLRRIINLTVSNDFLVFS